MKTLKPKTRWLLAAFLACGAVLLAALLWYPPLWQTGAYPAAGLPFASLNEDGTVNVNTAAVSELALLPGIGPAKAEAIVAHREESGPFAAAEDLLAVPGIGPKILEDLREYVSF